MADKVVLTGKRRGWGPKQKRVADSWVGAEEVPAVADDDAKAGWGDII